LEKDKSIDREETGLCNLSQGENRCKIKPFFETLKRNAHEK